MFELNVNNNKLQDILEDLNLLDENHMCTCTVEEVLKAGIEYGVANYNQIKHQNSIELDKLAKEFLPYFENSRFIEAMMEMYLKRNKLWDSNYWEEIIAVRHHDRENEWASEYDEFDSDFIECFICTFNGNLVKKCFLYVDFLSWQNARSK